MAVLCYPRQTSGGVSDQTKIVIPKVAGVALSGHRCLRTDDSGEAVYASADDPANLHRVIGIGTHAAAAGSSIQSVFFGEVTEPTWNWDLALPVWCGIDGALTQIPPASGGLLSIGFPINEQTLMVEVGEFVIL